MIQPRAPLFAAQTMQVALVAAAAMFVSPAHVEAQCVEDSTCVLTLMGEDAPKASPECHSEAWKKFLTFEGPKPFLDRDENGAWEAIVTLDLDPMRGCARATIRATLAEEATGWLVHVGDSPSNDGYGGDWLTTSHNAEAHLTAGKTRSWIHVLSSVHEDGRRFERPLRLELPTVAGNVVEMVVADQRLDVKVTEPGAETSLVEANLEAPLTQQLFALTGQPELAIRDWPGMPDHRIHAAFHRVVHRSDGTSVSERHGTGVEKVEIELAP